MSLQAPKLFLVDGNSYIYRAFHSVPTSLRTAAGLPTGAIFGFYSILARLINQHRPEYIAVALDHSRVTFRNDIYPAYKGNRAAPPSDLVPQFPYIRKLLDACNIPMLEMQGYEADDIIATLAAQFSGSVNVVVVSSDKDLMQLVSPGVELYDSAKGQWIGDAAVKSKFGVLPQTIPEVLGLMGDAVDNIPGVRGIGDKGAVRLIQQFGTLETLYANLDCISGRGAERTCQLLRVDKEMAFLSRELATVKRDVPIDVEQKALEYRGADSDRFTALFEELEFPNMEVASA